MRGERMWFKTTSEHQVQQNMPIPLVAADSKSGLHERQIVGAGMFFLYRFLINVRRKFSGIFTVS
jgi:hypothetical protein